jgi:hypothetical protein
MRLYLLERILLHAASAEVNERSKEHLYKADVDEM